MGIELGLSRVSKLLKHLGSPHKAYKSIHVAGTNGKGSTLAYISSILTEAKVKNGRFTSPHILLYNDCISIDNVTYPMQSFQKIKSLVESSNAKLQLECTEFEILTCAAFKIFELEKVQVALIEVGLGGSTDATNVLEPLNKDKLGVVVTAITKIGIDHESFLGNTIGEIAKVKGGIMKSNVPCVVDGSNLPEAITELKEIAKEQNSQLYLIHPDKETQNFIQYSPLRGAYQEQNLAVALKVLDIVQSGQHLDVEFTEADIIRGLEKTLWPGRLQEVTEPKTGLTLLLDGAHNESAAIELGKYLKSDSNYSNGAIFVTALSKGKSIETMFRHIVSKEKDTIIPAIFTPPEEMPWVSCYKAEEIASRAKAFASDVRVVGDGSFEAIVLSLQQLRAHGDDRPIVVCGSLYLCSNVLNRVTQ